MMGVCHSERNLPTERVAELGIVISNDSPRRIRMRNLSQYLEKDFSPIGIEMTFAAFVQCSLSVKQA